MRQRWCVSCNEPVCVLKSFRASARVFGCMDGGSFPTLFGNGTGTEREQNGNEQGAPAPATPYGNERGNGTERERNGKQRNGNRERTWAGVCVLKQLSLGVSLRLWRRVVSLRSRCGPLNSLHVTAYHNWHVPSHATGKSRVHARTHRFTASRARGSESGARGADYQPMLEHHEGTRRLLWRRRQRQGDGRRMSEATRDCGRTPWCH